MATITLTSPENGAVDVGTVSGDFIYVILEFLLSESSEPWNGGDCIYWGVLVDEEDAGNRSGWQEEGTYKVFDVLYPQTTYTWRVIWLEINPDPDPVHLQFTTATWTFTTGGPPAKPVNVSPTNEATGITLKPTLRWEDGGGAETYSVYAGLSSGNLTLLGSDLEDVSILAPIIDYYTPLYWRVDAKNSAGETEGDEWYYTSMKYDPPLPTGITLDYGYTPPAQTGTPTGESNMITIRKLVAAAANKIWYEDI